MFIIGRRYSDVNALMGFKETVRTLFATAIKGTVWSTGVRQEHGAGRDSDGRGAGLRGRCLRQLHPSGKRL